MSVHRQLIHQAFPSLEPGRCKGCPTRPGQWDRTECYFKFSLSCAHVGHRGLESSLESSQQEQKRESGGHPLETNIPLLCDNIVGKRTTNLLTSAASYSILTARALTPVRPANLSNRNPAGRVVTFLPVPQTHPIVLAQLTLLIGSDTYGFCSL